MASRVIRRSKSDPNYLARRKVVALVDGKLFTRHSETETDEECLLSREPGRFRKRNQQKDGSVKRGLRVTKAYMVDGDNSSASTDDSLRDKPSRVQEFNRRHTVGGSLTTVHEEISEDRDIQEGKQWRKDALIGYLEDQYKDYYHSTGNMDHSVEMAHINGYTETDLDDTMSEIDTAATSGFKRGGHARASLPVVRHGINKSKEKPLGLIYLQYMNETKRALMPNEVTGMDTVRALFVRSFKGRLNMEMLDLPARKIYIRDPLTEIFYELENSHEVKDRTVLKIYEPGFQESTDAGTIRSTASTPVDMSYLSEPEVDQQARQRRYHTMAMPVVKERENEGRERTNSEGATAAYNKQGVPAQKQVDGNTHPDRRHPPQERRQPQQPQYFNRGAPERATVGGTTPHRPPQNQAPFQRGIPGRASATMPRGEHMRGGNMDRRGPGPPSHQHGPPQERRDNKQATQGPNRVNGPSGSRPINSGSKTLPPGASLENPRTQQSPHPQRLGVPRGGPPQQGVRHGPDGGRRIDPNHQGPRSGPPSQSYSTSPRRVPPQQNGPVQVTGHRSQPDLRAAHSSSPSAIQQGKVTQDDTSKRIASMEAQIANLAGMVRTALHHGDSGSQSAGGSPTRTNPQKTNGTVQSQPVLRGPPPGHQRQHPGPGHPSHGWGQRGPGTMAQGPMHRGGRPEHGGRAYHSAQNSPRMGRQQRNLSLPPPQQTPQQTHQQTPQQTHHQMHQHVRDEPLEPQDLSPKLNLVPAQVEFIPPTGEPTTPNIGYIKTTEDSQSGNPPEWQPTSQGGQRVTPQPRQNSPLVRSGPHLERHIRELREEQEKVRNMHIHMVKHMNESFRNTSQRINRALDSRAGLHGPQPIRSQGGHIRQEVARYNHKKEVIDKELKQLEMRVEKLRVGTVSSRSQVDSRSVDNLAQLLGNSSRLIAEQKAMFPLLAEKLKATMEGEMEIVVVEERFLRDEPGMLDDYFKRCKTITGTLYTLKRLAEVQDRQGSSSDLTSELQMSESSQSPVQQSPAPSPVRSGSSKRVVSQTNVQVSSQPPPPRKTLFASPAQKSRFEQALRDGRKNLRTTLFAQNAALRQKRHITALYKQDRHDDMTPIVTPEKEARKSLTRKKGPPPPPPPRRGASIKFSQTVTDGGTSGMNVVGRKEVQVREMNGTGTMSVPDICHLGGVTPLERKGSGSVPHSPAPGLSFIPPHTSSLQSQPPSSSCTPSPSVLSKSCDSNLHEFHQQRGAPTAPTRSVSLHHQSHAQNVKDSRVNQHGFRAIQSGVSEPDVTSPGPPKPPRGQINPNSAPKIAGDQKSAFQVVAPMPRMISAHSGIRNAMNFPTRSGIPITATKRGPVPTHPRPTLNGSRALHGTNTGLSPGKTDSNIPTLTKKVTQINQVPHVPHGEPNLNVETLTSQPSKVVSPPQESRPSNHKAQSEKTKVDVILSATTISTGDVKRPEHEMDQKNTANGYDLKTEQLREEYAKLRALQTVNPTKSMEKKEGGTCAGTGTGPKLTKIPKAATLGALPNEILIQGKSNLHDADERNGNSIDRALDDLETFALRAGDFNSFGTGGPSMNRTIVVESDRSHSSETVQPEASEKGHKSREHSRKRSLSDGDITLDAALDKLISNNNVGEKSPTSSETWSEAVKNYHDPDEEEDEKVNSTVETVRISENIVIEGKTNRKSGGTLSESSSNTNNNRHALPAESSEVRLSKRGSPTHGQGNQSETSKVSSQQITIISPRGEIEETFIF